MESNLTFGQFLRKKREGRHWTIRQFTNLLKKEGVKVSPPYITRIEKYGEIPSAKFTCTAATILDVRPETLLEKAKNEKILKFTQSLNDEYNFQLDEFSTSLKNHIP